MNTAHFPCFLLYLRPQFSRKQDTAMIHTCRVSEAFFRGVVRGFLGLLQSLRTGVPNSITHVNLAYVSFHLNCCFNFGTKCRHLKWRDYSHTLKILTSGVGNMALCWGPELAASTTWWLTTVLWHLGILRPLLIPTGSVFTRYIRIRADKYTHVYKIKINLYAEYRYQKKLGKY